VAAADAPAAFEFKDAAECDGRFDALLFMKEQGLPQKLLARPAAATKKGERIREKRAELVLVLGRAEIPPHNNVSGNDIQEWAKKRKISAGTRSEVGRRCRISCVKPRWRRKPLPSPATCLSPPLFIRPAAASVPACADRPRGSFGLYRGEPEPMYAVRRQRLAEARHRRREKNLQLRPPALPLTSEETAP